MMVQILKIYVIATQRYLLSLCLAQSFQNNIPSFMMVQILKIYVIATQRYR